MTKPAAYFRRRGLRWPAPPVSYFPNSTAEDLLASIVALATIAAGDPALARIITLIDEYWTNRPANCAEDQRRKARP